MSPSVIFLFASFNNSFSKTNLLLTRQSHSALKRSITNLKLLKSLLSFFARLCKKSRQRLASGLSSGAPSQLFSSIIIISAIFSLSANGIYAFA